jgi:hypothetical protein
VQVRIWVPGQVPPGIIERAVEAAWPAARTHTTHTPQPALPPEGVVMGGRLRMARPDWLPLRADHPADPLRALIGAASGLAPGQHAVVQICARPATGHRLARAHRAAAALRGGTQSGRPWGWLFDLITPVPAGRSSQPSAYVAHPERAAEVKAILDKSREPQWEAVIRYGLAADPAQVSTGTPAKDSPAVDPRTAQRDLERGLGVRCGAAPMPSPRPTPCTPGTTTCAANASGARRRCWDGAGCGAAICCR